MKANLFAIMVLILSSACSTSPKLVEGAEIFSPSEVRMPAGSRGEERFFRFNYLGENLVLIGHFKPHYNVSDAIMIEKARIIYQGEGYPVLAKAGLEVCRVLGYPYGYANNAGDGLFDSFRSFIAIGRVSNYSDKNVIEVKKGTYGGHAARTIMCGKTKDIYNDAGL